MSWEWSHSQEAYELAEKNLGKKSIKWLAECLAEWACEEIGKAVTQFEADIQAETDRGDGGTDLELPALMTTDPLTDGRYDRLLRAFAKDDKEYLVERIWAMASEQATCENGGYSPWMCPHGCHTVEW